MVSGFCTLGCPSSKEAGLSNFDIYFVAWLKGLNYEAIEGGNGMLWLRLHGDPAGFIEAEVKTLDGVLNWIEHTLEAHGGKKEWILTREGRTNSRCIELVHAYKNKMGGERQMINYASLKDTLERWRHEKDSGFSLNESFEIDLLTIMFKDLIRVRGFWDKVASDLGVKIGAIVSHDTNTDSGGQKVYARHYALLHKIRQQIGHAAQFKRDNWGKLSEKEIKKAAQELYSERFTNYSKTDAFYKAYGDLPEALNGRLPVNFDNKDKAIVLALSQNDSSVEVELNNLN